MDSIETCHKHRSAYEFVLLIRVKINEMRPDKNRLNGAVARLPTRFLGGVGSGVQSHVEGDRDLIPLLTNYPPLNNYHPAKGYMQTNIVLFDDL